VKLRHKIERACVAALVIGSVLFAWRGEWAAGQYLLVLAAVIDFDDWIH
jgi:hypothetical protein